MIEFAVSVIPTTLDDGRSAGTGVKVSTSVARSAEQPTRLARSYRASAWRSTAIASACSRREIAAVWMRAEP
jgi:hypothetical protein